MPSDDDFEIDFDLAKFKDWLKSNSSFVLGGFHVILGLALFTLGLMTEKKK
jgi:hypothetical protein